MNKIKKIVVNYTVSLSSLLLRHKKYETDSTLVKVNLGCGLRCSPDWINIDGSLTALLGSKRFVFINKILYKLAGSSHYYSFEAFNKVIQTDGLSFFDLRKGVPFRSNYCDVIYCSHFLEHLNKKDGQSFLRECFRVLKPGGILRIIVPDLDVAFSMYKKNEIEKMQSLFFFTSDDWDFAAHKFNYNFSYLKGALEEAGFNKVEKMAFQKGKCPDIGYLDVHPEHSLYVEGIKP